MQFSPRQRDLAIMALDEAEERTTGYYCIPPYRWQQTTYDLVTRQDCEWEPFPEIALARIQRMGRVSPVANSSSDFYRIHLNDPGILDAAVRENLAHDLYPFLVYILTHELVHLVRLSTILPEGGNAPLAPEQEERRVQAVSYRILRNTGHPNLKRILSRFCVSC